MTEQKGKGTKELEELKHLSMKIQKVTLNVATTQKNEKHCVSLQLITKFPLMLMVLVMTQ